jgi:acyl-CoA synthetase (NDP forming)
MDRELTDRLLNAFLTEGQVILSEFDAKEILRSCGIPVPACSLVETAQVAVQVAEEIGYPVVLKVHSPAIIHKSDVGGVKLNLRDSLALEKAYAEIVFSCSPIDSKMKVLVQPMLSKGIEAILGVSRDAQFGPVIMFGLGGIYTELFNDVAFRLIPVSKTQAMDMVSSIRAFALLKGYRGNPGGDISSLVEMIVRLSDLLVAHPEITELDLNPVIVYPMGVAIADARMVLNR